MADQNLTLKIKVGVDGQPQVELLNQSLGKLQNTTKSMSSGFDGIKTALKGFAAAFTIREVFNFGKSVIDLGDQLQKASLKTGIAVSELSKLKAGAELADVSFEGLQVGIKKLGVNLVEAANGNKQLESAFKAVGVGAKDLKNLNTSDALSKIADAFEKSKDGAEKAAIAVKLFGRNGTELIPFLNQGSEGIKKFGLEVSDEFAANAEKFNDSIKLMKNTLTQVGINSLGPILEPLRSFFLNLGVEIDFVSTRIRQTFTYFSGFIEAIKGKFSDVSAVRAKTNAELLKLDDDFNKRSKDAAKQFYTAGLPSAPNSKATVLDTSKTGENTNRIKSETDALNDYVTKQKEAVELLKLEGQRINLSDIEYKKLVETKKHQAETEKDLSRFTGSRLKDYKRESDAFLEQKLKLMELNEQQSKTFGYGAKQAFDEYINQARNTAALVKEAFSGSFKKLEDSLVNFVKTGKLNFTELANYIIDEIIRIQVKQAVIAPLLGVISGIFSSGATSTATVTPNANGGVMTSEGPMALNYYARGGIASSPQLALFGEGSTPEAFVPLPDGRRIPVVMKSGDGGTSNSVSVVVNVNSDGSSNVESNKKFGKEIGDAINVAVRQQLIKEKRPGGLIS